MGRCTRLLATCQWCGMSASSTSAHEFGHQYHAASVVLSGCMSDCMSLCARAPEYLEPATNSPYTPHIVTCMQLFTATRTPPKEIHAYVNTQADACWSSSLVLSSCSATSCRVNERRGVQYRPRPSLCTLAPLPLAGGRCAYTCCRHPDRYANSVGCDHHPVLPAGATRRRAPPARASACMRRGRARAAASNPAGLY